MPSLEAFSGLHVRMMAEYGAVPCINLPLSIPPLKIKSQPDWVIQKEVAEFQAWFSHMSAVEWIWEEALQQLKG